MVEEFQEQNNSNEKGIPLAVVRERTLTFNPLQKLFYSASCFVRKPKNARLVEERGMYNVATVDCLMTASPLTT